MLPSTRPPSVLFVSSAYPPSGGEPAVALRDIAVNLVQRGWRVTVLTGSCDASALLTGGVRVVRIGGWSEGAASDGLLLRLVGSIFYYPAMVVRALSVGPTDVVVTQSAPPFLLALGWILGLLLRARTVHWADALYPEIRPLWGPIDGLLRRLSSALLRRQDRVVAVGRCMADRLMRRRVTRTRVIPGWPVQTLRPVEHRFNAFRRENDLQGKFAVMYSGPLATADEVAPLLSAAAEIKGAYPDIRFVLVGDGPGRAGVAERIEADGLENVRLMSPILTEATSGTADRESGRLGAADLHVVTMEEDDCGVAVPGALYAAMAVRRPCLFVGPEESEAALFVREHGAGEAVADPDGLSLRILGWYQSDVRRRIAGDRAYRAVRLLRANALIEFEDMLRGLLAAPAAEIVEVHHPNALAA